MSCIIKCEFFDQIAGVTVLWFVHSISLVISVDCANINKHTSTMTVRKDNLIEQKLEVWKNTQMQVHMDMDFPCHSFATHIIFAVRKSGA